MGGLKKLVKKVGKKLEKVVKNAAPVVVGGMAGGPLGALAGYQADKMLRHKRKLAEAAQANVTPDFSASSASSDGNDDRAPTVAEQLGMLKQLLDEGALTQEQYNAAVARTVA